MTLARPSHGDASAPAGIGDSPARPDGIAKVQGSFAFSSRPADRRLPVGRDAALAAPVRPHRRASTRRRRWRSPACRRRRSPPTTCPASSTYGLIAADQPVFASDVVRYVGEPVAAVAADHPETCRRALAAIVVEYEVLDPLIDPEAAIDGIAPADPSRRQRASATSGSCCGDVDATGDVVVEGTYEIGMQDQAFLGLEAALAMPDDDGAGVELYVATQWLHEDRKQIAACLGLPEEQVRLVLGGVGGAFGAREDISLQVHTLPAGAAHSGGRCGSRTAAPRASSATSTATRRRSGCATTPPPTATIVKIEARFVLDGGAYASTSSAVLLNAITHAQGPYQCAERRGRRLGGAHQPPAVRGDARVRRRAGVLRPRGPDGQARRGVRARPGRDPAAQRDGDRRPADHRAGRRERRARSPAASARPRRCRCPTTPIGVARRPDGIDPMRLPGGAGLTADVGHVRRGVGLRAWRSRTSCTPRASTTTRRPAAGWPTAWPR